LAVASLWGHESLLPSCSPPGMATTFVAYLNRTCGVDGSNGSPFLLQDRVDFLEPKHVDIVHSWRPSSASPERSSHFGLVLRLWSVQRRLGSCFPVSCGVRLHSFHLQCFVLIFFHRFVFI
jgi:hypothetical protein